MNNRRKTQELNTLSAYLDHALNPKERQMLEARLVQEPALREQLENLRITKMIIGHLQRVRAPHNFTLTPDMVKVRRPKRHPLVTFLRLASSLSAIMLVVAFGVELLLNNGQLMGRPMVAEPAMEAAYLLDEDTPEPLILWGAPNEGLGVGAIEEESVSKDIPEISPEEDAAPPPEIAEVFSANEQMAGESQPILGVNPDAAGEVIERSVSGDDTQQPERSQLSPIRWLQIALGSIVLGSVLFLWLLRRRETQTG